MYFIYSTLISSQPSGNDRLFTIFIILPLFWRSHKFNHIVCGLFRLVFFYLLLLIHFSRVWLCATPSLVFSRQEHWSGLPFPSPMHKSEKWKWSCSPMSDSSRPHGLQPTRLLHPWDFPGKSTGVGCHCLLLLLLSCVCLRFILTFAWLHILHSFFS